MASNIISHARSRGARDAVCPASLDPSQAYQQDNIRNRLTDHSASQYYDVPSLPESDDDEIDIWYFIWGDSQADVPTGHSKALLLWEPTSTS